MKYYSGGWTWRIHQKCDECGKIAHVKDVIKVKFDDISILDSLKNVSYYQIDCYKKRFKVKHCPCGNGWIKK